LIGILSKRDRKKWYDKLNHYISINTIRNSTYSIKLNLDILAKQAKNVADLSSARLLTETYCFLQKSIFLQQLLVQVSLAIRGGYVPEKSHEKQNRHFRPKIG
jgi:hypothetical protein